MRSHAGLLPLYSDRDTQGLTLHIILCCVCFPDAIKNVTKNTECTSSELLAFPAGEMWRVRLQICHRPGLWWATGAAVWAPRGSERKGNSCPLIIVPGKMVAGLVTAQVEGSVRVRPQLLELSWCYDTSVLQLSIFNYCVCRLVWGAGISSSALQTKQSSE